MIILAGAPAPTIQPDYRADRHEEIGEEVHVAMIALDDPSSATIASGPVARMPSGPLRLAFLEVVELNSRDQFTLAAGPHTGEGSGGSAGLVPSHGKTPAARGARFLAWLIEQVRGPWETAGLSL